MPGSDRAISRRAVLRRCILIHKTSVIFTKIEEFSTY